MSYISKRGKNSAWRRSVLKNLVADVILYEKIETNSSNVHRLDKLLSKLIKWAKNNTVHSRRLALRYLINKKSVRIWQNEEKTKILKKLFDQLGERYKDRLGGYSRIVRLEPRLGDNAPRVIFSLV